jgi:hypothetical protein
MAPAHELEAARATHGGWRALQVRDRWRQVRVDVAELVATGSACRVRAVVHLGALSPADVHVELTPASAALADVGATPSEGDAAVVAYPLWCDHSYDNGCYVFDRVLSPIALVPHDAWSVRVRPAVATLPHVPCGVGPAVERRIVTTHGPETLPVTSPATACAEHAER